ncbi:phosphotransferase [Pseudactinotalea suaedae]|uniref:phosphotransferase n=1 Tax=Pseudactinotalea suaedae TaxID=1524924 RepID=UPI0012E1C433|nr:phosphotransferase [Pseudactinotalea suaedae]
MEESEEKRAVEAARSIAVTAGLPVENAIVLQSSNKLAVRLLPCDVLARVSRWDPEGVQLEVDLAGRLEAAGCPIGVLDPRVEPRAYRLDGFTVTLWTFYESVPELPAADYGLALQRLHAGMRTVEMATPHALDRVASAQRLLADRDLTPELPDDQRALLSGTLEALSPMLGDRDGGQLLHGEPHPGNVLATRDGPLFIDLETFCRGPVELDLAHAPDDVAEHYPGADPELLRQCRMLVLAMIIAWRWDRDDRLPGGRELGAQWLAQLRTMLGSAGMR